MAIKRYLLTIKGDEKVAFAACSEHGIEITSIVKHERFNECIVTCSTAQEKGDVPAILAKWFCEPGTPADGYGYPDGTLLYYGELFAKTGHHAVPHGWDVAQTGTEGNR